MYKNISAQNIVARIIVNKDLLRTKLGTTVIKIMFLKMDCRRDSRL